MLQLKGAIPKINRTAQRDLFQTAAHNNQRIEIKAA